MADDQIDNKALPSEVIGLYSFPKSGNTWLRQIVASALDIPANILHKYVTDMHNGKIMQNPFIYNGKRLYIYKSHHRQLVVEHKEQKIKNDKVVYIYRHPLDVFLSYINFLSKNVNSKAPTGLQFEIESVENLSPDQLDALYNVFLVYGTITPQNRVFGGYFEHIFSAFALRDQGFPIHILEYEDLHTDFAKTASGVLEFLDIKGVDVETTRQEADKRTAQDGKFFWKRQAENYKNYLSEAQIAKFNRMYPDNMKLIGYPTA